MKLSYLGTAAAEGCPALFCKCDFCEGLRRARDVSQYRTRSQVLINDDLLVDFPPDTYLHFLRDQALDLSSVKNILVTHSHSDHFYPEDILLHNDCFSDTAEGRLHIYGNRTVVQRCTALFDAAPEMFHAGQYLAAHLLEPFQTVPVGRYQITPLLADHDRAEQCYLYVIQQQGQTILYANDTGIQLCEQTLAVLGGFRFDLVSMDCTACDRDVARNHMGIPNNFQFVRMLKDLGAVRSDTRYVITHFSHHLARTQQQLEQLVSPYGWLVAHDRMTIEL